MRAHEIIPKITLAKIEKTGQVVQLVKHADQVGFSDETGWFLINTNPGADTGSSNTVKWIPDTTRFEWVRKFNNLEENFANGKNPGRKGLAKRVGVNCKQSVTKLRDIAKHSSGEKQRMAHWCANMKSGKKKSVNEATNAEDVLDYVKRKHGSDFDIDHAINDHPNWHLTLVPIRKLKLDPEGKHQDPYGRVNSVNSDTVNDILPNIQNIVRSSPIVVDSDGWIIDGNHRATAAHLAGLKQIPAYIPIN